MYIFGHFYTQLVDSPTLLADKFRLYTHVEFNVILGSYICENKLIHTGCPERTSADATPVQNFTSTADSFTIILSSDNSFERHGFIMQYTENYVATTTTAATTTTTATAPPTSNLAVSSQTSTTSKNCVFAKLSVLIRARKTTFDMLSEKENIIILVVKYSKIAVCKIILILHLKFLSC